MGSSSSTAMGESATSTTEIRAGVGGDFRLKKLEIDGLQGQWVSPQDIARAYWVAPSCVFLGVMSCRCHGWDRSGLKING